MKTDSGANVVQNQVGKNLRLVDIVKFFEALACKWALNDIFNLSCTALYILYCSSETRRGAMHAVALLNQTSLDKVDQISTQCVVFGPAQ